MEQTPLEIIESGDMIQIVDNGLKIRLVKTKYATHAVDTVEDRGHVEELMKNDHPGEVV